MKSIFLKTLKERWLSVAVYTGLAILLLIVYLGSFSAIRDQAKQLQDVLKAYPEGFMKAFGLENSTAFFDNIENFLSTEQFSFIWPILVIAMTISQGGSAIAGEIESQTIEFLLSKPITRVRIFFAKYLAAIANLLFFDLISILIAIPLASAFGYAHKTANFFTMAIVGAMFGLAILSLSFLFSSIFSDKGKPYFITAGIVVLMYALNIISALKTSLDSLKYLSFFHYYSPGDALGKNHIDPLAFFVFLGVSAISTALAVYIFSKRDVAV